MNWGNHFGLITIDWSRADPRLCLQMRIDGDVTIQQILDLSTLQPGVNGGK